MAQRVARRVEERDGAPAVRSTFSSVRVWGHDEAPPSDHYVLESLDVVAALNGRFTDAQVREAVESLVNDGHLYSTIDDAHFRSTLL